MSEFNIRRHLEKSGVVIDPMDNRDLFTIGQAMGLVGLELEGIESPGIFTALDILRMRRNEGRFVEPVAYGQAVFRAIPLERSAL